MSVKKQVELKWMGTMDTFKLYAGIAVKLESEGHKAGYEDKRRCFYGNATARDLPFACANAFVFVYSLCL